MARSRRYVADRARRLAALRQRWESHLELATFPRTVASCLDATAMHLDQPLYECQPDSKTALRPIQRMISLREEVEYARRHLRRNSDTGIAYPEHDFLMLALPQ